MATYLPSLKLSKYDEQDMQDTAREVRMNSQATFSLHMDVKVLDNQLEPMYNSSIRTKDVVCWKTYQK